MTFDFISSKASANVNCQGLTPLQKKISQPLFFVWVLAFVVTANFFAWFFVHVERTVYFWDYAVYWMKFESIMGGLRANPLEEWMRLDASIRYQVYNNAAIWPLMPFAWIGGTSRMSYILSVVNVWMIPAALTFYRPRGDRTLVLFLVFACPALWVTVLRGWFDVGGLIFANLVLAAAFKHRSSVPIPFSVLSWMSVALAALPLFRRWYVFWVVSFGAAFILDGIWDAVVSRDRRKAFLSIGQGLMLGAMTVGIISIFSWPMPMTVLSTDYSALFSPYRVSESALGSLGRVFRYLGGFYVLAGLGGFTAALFDKSLRRLAIFLFAQTAMILWLFFRIQDLSMQHYILLLPSLIFFVSCWIRMVRHPVWTAAHSILVIASFIWVFLPGAERGLAFAKPLMPGIQCRPFYRDDVAELRQLRDTLAGLNPQRKDRVYVLSSSATLNSYTLNLAERSLGWPRQIERTILRTRSVDRSEGFPTDFFTARYVVVAEPVQYHMDPKNQTVVGYFAERLLKGYGVGLLYRRLPEEFRLEKDVRVLLFERTGQVGERELSEIRAYFSERYPQWGAFPIKT